MTHLYNRATVAQFNIEENAAIAADPLSNYCVGTVRHME
jgi:hypothetical protein